MVDGIKKVTRRGVISVTLNFDRKVEQVKMDGTGLWVVAGACVGVGL